MDSEEIADRLNRMFHDKETDDVSIRVGGMVVGWSRGDSWTISSTEEWEFTTYISVEDGDIPLFEASDFGWIEARMGKDSRLVLDPTVPFRANAWSSAERRVIDSIEWDPSMLDE